MMGTAHWTEFYNKFSDFANMARQYHFYDKEVQEMEYSLFEMCPLPKAGKQIIRNKVIGSLNKAGEINV